MEAPMFESNNQPFPSGVGRVSGATASVRDHALVARSSLAARPVGVMAGNPRLRVPAAVIIFVVFHLVGMFAVLWLWIEMLIYAGKLDSLSPYLDSASESTRRVIGILVWALPILLALITILVVGLCRLRNWARKTFIGLYILSLVASMVIVYLESISVATLYGIS